MKCEAPTQHAHQAWEKPASWRRRPSPAIAVLHACHALDADNSSAGYALVALPSTAVVSSPYIAAIRLRRPRTAGYWPLPRRYSLGQPTATKGRCHSGVRGATETMSCAAKLALKKASNLGEVRRLLWSCQGVFQLGD